MLVCALPSLREHLSAVPARHVLVAERCTEHRYRRHGHDEAELVAQADGLRPDLA